MNIVVHIDRSRLMEDATHIRYSLVVEELLWLAVALRTLVIIRLANTILFLRRRDIARTKKQVNGRTHPKEQQQILYDMAFGTLLPISPKCRPQNGCSIHPEIGRHYCGQHFRRCANAQCSIWNDIGKGKSN